MLYVATIYDTILVDISPPKNYSHFMFITFFESDLAQKEALISKIENYFQLLEESLLELVEERA